ncbi:unnamed protein product [Cyclocybe aegerita]|uniref:DNA 3'-5' helicase n=1 Tax=Cyclocybe aegerita TaxID=1973307 RepID=A0A8S0WRV9_CYCAE|nr:unnamed protein product [Cyclocybe aegerita]
MDPSALQDENASVFNQSTSLRNHPSPTPQSTNSGGTASFTSVSRLPLGNLALNSPSSSFATPRHRKKPGVRAGTDLVVGRVEPWPWIGRTVPLHLLEETSQEINGHDTKNWQMKLARKVLEGHDAIGIAGTGAGKSLVFGLLALAAELAGSPGIVIVLSPLKSLQKDQVQRINTSNTVVRANGIDKINLTAVEINEDNKDNKVFTRLEEGQYRLCYASPECLLRSNRFKQLFRTEEFRRKLVAVVIDKAHVIEAWKDEFRKDYGELAALNIIVGTEQALCTCTLCRSLITSPKLRKGLLPFTAVNSEAYKETVMDLFQDGKARWIFATIAAGMGMDIPDIKMVVIYGINKFGSAFQKGGRAGRSAGMKATAMWLIEPWVFEPKPETLDPAKPPSKKAIAEKEKREKLDPPTCEYIN